MPNINSAIYGKPDNDRARKKRNKETKGTVHTTPHGLNEVTDLVMKICDILEIDYAD